MPSLFLEQIKENVIGDKIIILGASTEEQQDLVFLKELVEIGKLRPVIDKQYPFAETRAAHAYAESGHKRGNLVIQVA